MSQADLRDKLKVDQSTVRQARHVKKDGVPALGAMVKAGTVKVAHAAQVADLSKTQEEKIVASGPDVVKAKAQQRGDHDRSTATQPRIRRVSAVSDVNAR